MCGQCITSRVGVAPYWCVDRRQCVFRGGGIRSVRVRRTRMEALAAQGRVLATVVLHGLDHLSRYIAGVQVGITLAGLALGRFGEPVLADILHPLFAWLFPPWLVDPEVRTGLTTGLSLLVITYLLVVLSELVPKAITLQCAEQVALLVASLCNSL